MSASTDTGTRSGGASPDFEHHDLTFAGAGVSASYVLLSLLAAATARPPASPLRIAVVERAPQPFAGLPYGDRAASTCLLITKLRDFLPDGERRLFTTWLGQRKAAAFAPFLEAGGPWSTRWWERHQDEIDRGEFDDLYLPRYLFGDYLAEHVRHAIAVAEEAGAASVQVLQDEVRSVAVMDGGYRLECAARSLTTRRLVLATGSPPVTLRMSEHGVPGSVVVDEPFEHLDRALGRIRDGLTRSPGQYDPVVVIIGANASTMDLLYQINDLGTPEVRRTTFVVLSPRGELPERMDEVNPSSSFRPECLSELGAAADPIDAESVYAAAVEDIARARAAGLPISDTLRPIAMGVVRVLPRLSPREALEFAGRWGAELGRHQRRAGSEYHEVVEHLVAEGRLRVVAGAFVDVSEDPGGRATVTYEHGGEVWDLGHPVDVIVNCGGPAREVERAHRFLPAQLIADQVCAATAYGGGIAVDASLQAAPGLYLMGPLLSGNVIDGMPVWHMEHCGRISAYGWALGAHLARGLLDGQPDAGRGEDEPPAAPAVITSPHRSGDAEYRALSPFG